MKTETKQKLHTVDKTYRMSELVTASGISRDMIKYYLRAGLLPAAEKPRANLSLYTENHLELIGLVQEFQQQTKLPLQDIADVFRVASYDANAIEIELLSAHYKVSDTDNIIPLKSQTEKTTRLDLPREFVQQLAKTSLLQSPELPSQNEDQLAGLLWAAHSAGVPLRFFEEVQKKLAELADLEVKTLIAIQRPELTYSDMIVNVTDVNRIINRWTISEKSRQIRSHFQKVIDNSDRAVSTLLDAVYQPSDLFRRRHDLDEKLDNLATKLESHPIAPEQAHALCLASLLLGDYEQTNAIAQSLLSFEVNQPISIAYVALAQALQNNVDLAFEYGSQLDNCQSSHPVILQARMLSLLLKASKLNGVADTAELMKSAGEIFLQFLQGPSMEEPEAILILARANVAFPDFANSRSQAISALHALLHRLETNTVEFAHLHDPDLQDSLLTVYRINTLYYLGSLSAMNDEPHQAAHYFEQVVQLDPASNFGKNAYLQLGL